MFHFLAVFVIGATVVWSAIYEYLHMMEKGYAELKDILLLFIYLELGAMIGIYLKRIGYRYSSLSLCHHRIIETPGYRCAACF